MGCDKDPWNNPYPYEDRKANVLYSAFAERPKHLDPARSYTSSEWAIICQIYEPPLQYHYLKRPYVLESLTAVEMPEVRYFSKTGKLLTDKDDPNLVAYTDYIIRIKPGIFYQAHPAFVKDEKGNYRYHHLSEDEKDRYHVLTDFKQKATREVLAEDYVYQIKRLAEPHLSSPIYGLMSRYIQGLKELRESLMVDASKSSSNLEIDLRPYPFTGAEVIDRYTYRIRIIGKYPQFFYWLAMPFFAPIPWELAHFYAQLELEKHNISLDWYPVGTGPFILTENNPERRMVLVKNLEFRGEFYPTEGMSEDISLGLLEDAGKPIPMIDKIIFTLEKENIPYWNKFLQGYYDISGVSSDNFGSSIHVTPTGGMEVTEALKKRGIRLQMSVAPGIWYWGFNLLDDTVGSYTDKARKLRQAISMVFDVEEFVSIFLNGRGTLAGGPIPTDIFGYEVEPKPKKIDVVKARTLLREADIKEGFTVYFDTVVTGDPDEMAVHAWLQKQFAKLGIEVIIRGTDFNRFQEKVLHGNVQMYFSGWSGDYPDPENFLFLLYGPNSSVKNGGENTANYHNPAYDKLFESMRIMNNSPKRLKIIQKMFDLLEKDSPWIWGFYPQSFTLYHDWIRVGKPSGIINNNLKYIKINPTLRVEQQTIWNQPILWPFWVIIVFVFFIFGPVLIRFWRKEHVPLRRQ